jgi:hypothetical protein
MEMQGTYLIETIAIDSILFAAFFYIWFNWVSPVRASFGESILSGVQFAIALSLAEFLLTSITTLPAVLREVQLDYGVNILAAIILSVYVSIRSGFSVSTIGPVFVLAFAAGVIGNWLRSYIYTPAIVGLEKAVGYNKGKSDLAPTPQKPANNKDSILQSI